MAKEKQESTEEGKTFTAEVFMAEIDVALARHRSLMVEELSVMITDLVIKAINDQFTALPALEEWSGMDLADGLQFTTEEMELIAAGWQAYGVAPQHQFASNIDRATGEAVLVTNGGAKVRYAAGQVVAPLHEVRITGINPKHKRRQLTGAGAKK
jgi:hypothetical protein